MCHKSRQFTKTRVTKIVFPINPTTGLCNHGYAVNTSKIMKLCDLPLSLPPHIHRCRPTVIFNHYTNEKIY